MPAEIPPLLARVAQPLVSDIAISATQAHLQHAIGHAGPETTACPINSVPCLSLLVNSRAWSHPKMVVIFVVCSRTPVARMVSVGGQDHRTENKRFGSFTSVGWLTTMPLYTPLVVHLRPQMEPFALPHSPLSQGYERGKKQR